MNPINRFITEQIGDRIESEVKRALSPLAPYLRRLGIGIALIVVSSGLWIAGLIFLLLSLFFYLGDGNAYFHPALLTGIITAVLGAVLTATGIALVRRPR